MRFKNKHFSGCIDNFMTSIEILKLNRNNYYLATEIEEKKLKNMLMICFTFFFKSNMMVVKYPWALPPPPPIFFVGGGLLLPLWSMDWLIICPWVIKSKLKSFFFIKKQSCMFLHNLKSSNFLRRCEYI